MIKKKNAIILLIVLVLLIGAVVSVNIVLKEDAPEPGSVSTSSMEIYTNDSGVESVNTILTDEEFTFTKSEDKWVWEERKNADTEKIKIDAYANEFTTILANKVIGDSGNLEDYGLDTPQATFTVRYTDGAEKVFLLGDESTVTQGYYFKDSDNDTVYLIYLTKGKTLLSGSDSFRIKALSSNDESTIIYIVMKYQDKTIELRRDMTKNSYNEISVWDLLSPVNSPCDDSKVKPLRVTFAALEISGYVEDDVTDLSKYGLDKPYVTVYTEDVNEKGFKFHVGDRVGDNYYVMVDGQTSVYTVDAESLSFIENDEFYYARKYSMVQYLNDVNGVTVKSADDKYILKVTETDGANIYTVNGIKTDATIFKADVYEKIIFLEADGFLDDYPMDKADITITFDMKKGRDIVYSLTKMTSGGYALFENEVCKYSVPEENVNDMLKALKDHSK